MIIMKKNIVILSTVLTALLISGCIETQDGEIQVTLASTEIRIGDMPTDDFSHINITFSQVKLHQQNEEENESWIVINSEPKTFDLIQLHIQNLTEQLGLTDIEIGNYTKLWIVIDNATGVLKETNSTVLFDIPSDILKIQQLFKIEEGNNVITIEINLDNSILVHNNNYKILPVLTRLQHTHKNELKFNYEDDEIFVGEDGSRGSPIKTYVNENITFNASHIFDFGLDDINFSWDFGDETTSTGAIVTHSYSLKGNYWVTVNAEDGLQEYTKYVHVTIKNSKGNKPN